MSLVEKISIATIKNRHEKTELKHQLKRLDQEKNSELRMMNTEKQRFKAKYSKLSYGVDSEPMDDKIVQRSDDNASTDYDYIHSLLFTNGEIDIEKILCLHLLSSHTTDSLTPTMQSKKFKNIPKEYSPVERLIERSKRKSSENSHAKLLPTYVLDILDRPSKDNNNNGNKDNEKASTSSTKENDFTIDTRLAARLIVNEKIMHLIETVMSALEHSNPEKMQTLVEMSQDVRKIKTVFRKPEIQDFLRTLKNHCLLNSCESFILASQFKLKPIRLEIKTLSGTLESVVKHIHRNILQYPTRNTWQKMYEESMMGSNKSSHEIAKEKEVTTKKPQELKLEENIIMKQKKAQQRHSKERRVSEQSQIDKMLGRHVYTNFIEKNKAAIANVKEKEYDEDFIPRFRRVSRDSQASGSSAVGSRRRSGTSSNMAPLKSTTAKIGKITEDVEPTDDISSHSALGSIKPETLTLDFLGKKRKSSDSNNSKLYIKQTTCPACMEKWKTPLPSPKTPTLTKLKDSTTDKLGNTVLQTNPINYINNMIDKEKFNLHSCEKRYSSDSGATKVNLDKKKSGPRYSFDSVELTPFDLAKIDQEIRELETRKKLEKFLDKK